MDVIVTYLIENVISSKTKQLTILMLYTTWVTCIAISNHFAITTAFRHYCCLFLVLSIFYLFKTEQRSLIHHFVCSFDGNCFHDCVLFICIGVVLSITKLFTIVRLFFLTMMLSFPFTPYLY